MNINLNEIRRVWVASGTSGTIFEFETTQNEVGYGSTVDGDYDVPDRFFDKEKDNKKTLAYYLVEWLNDWYNQLNHSDEPICLEWFGDEDDSWQIRSNRVVNGGEFYA